MMAVLVYPSKHTTFTPRTLISRIVFALIIPDILHTCLENYACVESIKHRLEKHSGDLRCIYCSNCYVRGKKQTRKSNEGTVDRFNQRTARQGSGWRPKDKSVALGFFQVFTGHLFKRSRRSNSHITKDLQISWTYILGYTNLYLVYINITKVQLIRSWFNLQPQT